MATTFRLNGKPIRQSKALAIVIDTWAENHHQQPGEYFAMACEQSQDGYIARDIIEAECEGLTIRHDNEEQG